jgi:hypothetical protein
MVCIVGGTWPQVSTWEIESNIIHGFVDKLGVVDECKGYVPPHVSLVGGTQFGFSVVIVVTNVKA